MLKEKLFILNKLGLNKRWILLDSFKLNKTNIINNKILKEYWSNSLKAKIDTKFYLHIPFCISLCNYCMYSRKKIDNKSEIDDYIDNIIIFLSDYKDLFKNKIFKWLYIWWWTPSILSNNNLEKILFYLKDNFSFSDQYYNTIELNPSTINYKKLDIISKSNINRISFWVQTFNKKTLLSEWREYVSTEYLFNMIKYSKTLWFKDINIDLIYWLWSENEIDLENNIKKILEVRPYSITIYTILKHKENSDIYIEDSENFYNKINDTYENIIQKLKVEKYYYIDKWSDLLWINLYLKDNKRLKTKPYEAHSSSEESLFWVWYDSFWKIWGKWQYTNNNWKFLFEKNYLEEEFYKYVLQSFQYEIDFSEISKIFWKDFRNQYKEELYYLLNKKLIKIIDNKLYYIWDYDNSWYYGLLFLDIKNLLKFIKYRFYNKK